MIKTLQKVGLEGTYLNVIKAIYDKATANIILKGDIILKGKISSKIRNKTRLPTVTTIIQLVLEVLATAIREEKEIKEYKAEKKN